MSQRFKKCKEDFICEKCGVKIKGNGYTNHCPCCLWSKHVDINPGDRKALCGGIMKPIKIETKRKDFIIVHKCVKCGYEKRNKASVNDNVGILLN
ncbi:MAG: RNHCP domain-containing protein [bacterium]